MAESKVRPWTDPEKLSILFQIIEKAGGIPWDALQLPEGRNKKSVQNMIDKEKAKIKKAREADGNGESTETAPKAKGKRGATTDGDDGEQNAKKKAKPAKKGGKKATKGRTEEPDDAADEDMFKTEPTEA
ncbi:hypothetical protein KC332_g16151 [Hortaea werneckii]|uniref:Myb-like domain-containing protein n=2 Tax=Hortaea werneckii TaxID=91943 RepID=A0A3M7I1Z3_HORWE|nr:hypothetical protein KC350_g15723 [Hortaea werneckii]KAI6804928.1 hypothetical protein KC358_g14559 [Hortaea werneckii]KAI6812379.1 hypothetical protein KC342_g17276 [Hortaea werneckii]KAI6905884.1 hypothetical protein KC348_g14850 [Hortaea werneckii]KAI6924023.1 hypothetical protein KC341_g14311 [Hortaea werneckii]